MDIHPCRSVCTKRQTDGSYRRHCKPDPAYPAGQPAAGGYFHRCLFHLPIHRYKRGNNRCPDSGSGGTGRENRYRPALYDSHCSGRFVLRRQSFLHIRHHHCIHQNAGLCDEGQVQNKFHDCSAGCTGCTGHLCNSGTFLIRRSADIRD